MEAHFFAKYCTIRNFPLKIIYNEQTETFFLENRRLPQNRIRLLAYPIVESTFCTGFL